MLEAKTDRCKHGILNGTCAICANDNKAPEIEKTNLVEMKPKRRPGRPKKNKEPKVTNEPKKYKTVALKIQHDIYNQLKILAQREERTVSGQIMYWLKTHIDDYIGLKK